MKISIIVPVYNEEKLIKECLDALINQNYTKTRYEIVVVNDGSIDDTFEVVKEKQKEAEEKGVEMKVVSLEKNQGRVIARETGAKKAKYNNLLFVDSRAIAYENVLENIKKIGYQPIVGNALIDPNRNHMDRFKFLIKRKLYPPFFGKSFEPIYITKGNFDETPKGTGIFFCDKELFLSSQLENKGKNTSDDTKLLWNIVQKKKFLKHPNVKVTSMVRIVLKDEIRHTFNRGIKFVNYYLNPKKKYFWPFILLPIIGLIFTIALIFINFTYFLYWLGFLILIWIFVSIWLAENIKDFFIVFGFLPIIALSFEIGILKGLILKLLKRY